jgi:hypothetical protein
MESFRVTVASISIVRRRRPPGEPPHGHEHTDPGEPRRINLSEELGLTENLTPVVIRKGSDV